MTALERALVIIRAMAALVALGGALAFLSGFFLSTSDNPRWNHVELPLGDAQGIAVDAKGRIYIGSRSYRRVHRYDGRGRFDRSWHIPAGKGTWWLGIGTDNTALLCIGSNESGTWYALEEKDRSNPIDPPRPRPEVWGIDTYKPAWSDAPFTLKAYPVTVSRQGNGSAPSVVFRQSWWRFLLMSPLPAWFVSLAGAIVLFALNRSPRRNAKALN